MEEKDIDLNKLDDKTINKIYFDIIEIGIPEFDISLICNTKELNKK